MSETQYTKIRLELGPTGRRCRLYIDDELMKGVCRVEVVADVDEVTSVVITKLLVEGEAGGIVDSTAIGHEFRSARRIG